MIELTSDMREFLKEHPGKPVEVVDPDTRQTFVIIRADVYERLAANDYDDSPWTDEEMDLLAAEDANSLGWEGMEAYQDAEP